MRLEVEVLNEHLYEMRKDKFFKSLINWILIIGFIGLITGLYF